MERLHVADEIRTSGWLMLGPASVSEGNILTAGWQEIQLVAAWLGIKQGLAQQ